MKIRSSVLIGFALILFLAVTVLTVKEFQNEEAEVVSVQTVESQEESTARYREVSKDQGGRREKQKGFGIEGIPDWVKKTGDYYQTHLGDFTKPLDEDELRSLAASPRKDRFRLKVLICRAGAEKNANFNYLLEQEGLRDDPWIDIALAGYDYSVNGSEEALDYVLEIHSKEEPGSDSDSVLVLSFIDEWHRSIPAVLKHFEKGTDGTGGLAYTSFWMARKFFFPNNFQRLIR